VKRFKEAVAAYRKFIELAPPQYAPYIQRTQAKIRELEGR